jgi:UDP:flavonoid glycosyltransferase YjiC (YdhE family)
LKLASKNGKAFITHACLLSIQEAISNGVPMITLPIFAEQDFNSFRLERTRRGIRFEANTLTLEHLQHAIAQILANPM